MVIINYHGGLAVSRKRYTKRQDIFVLPDTVWCKYPSLDTFWCNTDMNNTEFVYQTNSVFVVKYHSLCEWYKKLKAIRRYTKKAS